MSGVDTYHKKLQVAIACKTSFMNTTKWKFLFGMLSEISPNIRIYIKLLLDHTMREFTCFNTEYTNANQYIEEYWGVFQLKEIEWIYIPLEIRIERKNKEELLAPKIVVQNIEALIYALEKGKQFEYETSPSGLKIYGYK